LLKHLQDSVVSKWLKGGSVLEELFGFFPDITEGLNKEQIYRK